MPSGTATLDFGAHPGSIRTQLAVTGQTAILAGSKVGVAVRVAATAEHTADEVRVDPPQVCAGAIVAATGFTIYASSETTRAHYGRYDVDWTWV